MPTMAPNHQRLDIVRACMKLALQLDDAENEAISYDTSAANLDKWTSLTHVALILELEGSVGIEFDELEIVDLVSVEAILNAIDRKT